MIAKARLSQGLGVALVAGSTLVATATGASAAGDPLPTPDPPHLVSATVTGCTVPCKPGEVGELLLFYKLPPLPPGAPSDSLRFLDWVYANGKRIANYNETIGGDTLGIGFEICTPKSRTTRSCPLYDEPLRGDEVMTLTAFIARGDADLGTDQYSAESAPSNSLVPTQG